MNEEIRYGKIKEQFFHGTSIDHFPSLDLLTSNFYVTKSFDIAKHYTHESSDIQIILQLDLFDVEIQEDKPERYEFEQEWKQYIIQDEIILQDQLDKAFVKLDDQNEYIELQKEEFLILIELDDIDKQIEFIESQN